MAFILSALGLGKKGKTETSKKFAIKNLLDVCNEIINETVINVSQTNNMITNVSSDLTFKVKCKNEAKYANCLKAATLNGESVKNCENVAFCNIMKNVTIVNSSDAKVINSLEIDSTLVTKLQAEVQNQADQKLKKVQDAVGEALNTGVKAIGESVNALISGVTGANSSDKSEVENENNTKIRTVFKDTMTANFTQSLMTNLSAQADLEIEVEEGNMMTDVYISNSAFGEAVSQAFLKTALGKDIVLTMKNDANQSNEFKSRGLTDIVDTVGDVINNTVNTIGGVFSSGIMGWVIIIVVFLLVILGMWYILGSSKGLQDLASKGINKA